MPIDTDFDQDHRTMASYRRQLIDVTEGTELNAGPFALRLSNVPLFRETPEGMRQVVRVRAPGGTSAAGLMVRLLDGDREVDAQDMLAVGVPQSVFLLAPEVDAPTPYTVEASVGGEVLGSVAFEVTPQRKWEVHLVHQSHYDIGYTDTQGDVMASQLAYIDAALELATITDGWDDDARFRWTVEVNWPLQQWLRTRPKRAREELFRRVAEGRIELNALPFSMHTEAYSHDELAQQLVFARELRETHDIDVVTAMQTDVPGATIGLASLLTDAGVTYLAVAHNYAGRSIPHHLDGQDLTRPFWWEAPDGERLLVWYCDTLYGVAYMEAVALGFSTGYEEVEGSLGEYLAALAQVGYPYGHQSDWLSGSLDGVEIRKTPYAYDILHLRVQSEFADNAAPALYASDIARQWNETWAFPRLRTSTNRAFFEEVEARHGDDLDTFSGDWTDWWADGIGSAAEALGRNRQSQNDIRTAQTLHALADALTDDPSATVAVDTRQAYEHMALFDEHTWGAANPWLQGALGMAAGEHQWTRKAAFAFTAEEEVRTLLDSGLRRFAPLAASGSSSNDIGTLLVFNPSSFARTDLARVFLPERETVAPSFELVDLSSGASVPIVIEPQPNASYRPRGRWLRFLARDVPALGYARYGLRSAAWEGLVDGDTRDTGMANDLLAVEIDPATATVRSLIDGASGAEVVAPGPFGFNAYVYDEYATAPNFNHLSGRIGSAGPWMLGSRGTAQYGQITARESNAVWERMKVRFSGAGADWLETTFTLPHGVSRLHIANRLHKPSTMVKESAYFAFPFAVAAGANGEPTFEITGGTAGPESPHVPGSAHWFRAIRHWATLPGESGPVAWATKEAPLVQAGNIRIPYAPFPPSIPPHLAHDATIYSWALNNIWDTNFPPQQGGEMEFAYTAATGGDDAAALGRDTAAATATPLVGVMAPIGAVAVGDEPDRASFLSVADGAVEISHLAPARDGGIAVWLFSHASERVETTLRVSGLPVTAARTGTFLETAMQDAALRDGEVAFRIDAGELKVVVLAIG